MEVQIFLSMFNYQKCMEYSQVVRHPFLVWTFKGSNPFTPKGPVTQLVRVYA